MLVMPVETASTEALLPVRDVSRVSVLTGHKIRHQRLVQEEAGAEGGWMEVSLFV